MKRIKTLTKTDLEFLSKVDPFRYEPAYKSQRILNLKNEREIETRLMSIFLSVGISAHLQGYQYLKEAIKLIMSHPDYINSVTKKLYPLVAMKCETTPVRVERGIRHAIESSFSKGKMIYLNNIFGLDVLRGDEKPTNAEFVALIADKLLLEGR